MAQKKGVNMNGIAEFVTPGVALTHWMAEQVPTDMRGGKTDPFEIVEFAFGLMRESCGIKRTSIVKPEAPIKRVQAKA